ncbi:hypothetical protein [Undibacterium sp. Tian12W]|uniref:hypothetical protein n=1 Tax=Undibacterium sp. Tian12W TaxID=3413054 RepID=UPI003BF0C96A
MPIFTSWVPKMHNIHAPLHLAKTRLGSMMEHYNQTANNCSGAYKSPLMKKPWPSTTCAKAGSPITLE